MYRQVAERRKSIQRSSHLFLTVVSETTFQLIMCTVHVVHTVVLDLMRTDMFLGHHHRPTCFSTCYKLIDNFPAHNSVMHDRKTVT